MDMDDATGKLKVFSGMEVIWLLLKSNVIEEPDICDKNVRQPCEMVVILLEFKVR